MGLVMGRWHTKHAMLPEWIALVAPAGFGLFAWLSKQAHSAAMGRFKAIEDELHKMRMQFERHETDDTTALRDIAINQATVIERLDHVREQLHHRRGHEHE